MTPWNRDATDQDFLPEREPVPREGDPCAQCCARRASYDHGINRYRCDHCGWPDLPVEVRQVPAPAPPYVGPVGTLPEVDARLVRRLQ